MANNRDLHSLKKDEWPRTVRCVHHTAVSGQGSAGRLCLYSIQPSVLQSGRMIQREEYSEGYGAAVFTKPQWKVSNALVLYGESA